MKSEHRPSPLPAALHARRHCAAAHRKSIALPAFWLGMTRHWHFAAKDWPCPTCPTWSDMSDMSQALPIFLLKGRRSLNSFQLHCGWPSLAKVETAWNRLRRTTPKPQQEVAILSPIRWTRAGKAMRQYPLQPVCDSEKVWTSCSSGLLENPSDYALLFQCSTSMKETFVELAAKHCKT